MDQTRAEWQARVATTAELLAINAAARRHGLHAQADPDRLTEILDPDGLHVLTVLMSHDEERLDTPFHLRCLGLLKPVDGDGPVEVVMDVPYSLFEQLPTGTEFKARMA